MAGTQQSVLKFGYVGTRLAVLQSLGPRFDYFLSRADSIRSLFVAVNGTDPPSLRRSSGTDLPCSSGTVVPCSSGTDAVLVWYWPTAY
eukprot:2900915-Rhodomonas_salina.2